MRVSADVLVIGSGIAGLSFALKAAEKYDVALVTKTELDNTKYAQGGIAAVMTTEDSFELHVQDTLTAGAGLCNEEIVRLVVRDGPARIRELVELGVHFDHKDGGSSDYDLHREGGHTMRRIVHTGDLTGEEVERALLARVAANPRIKTFEHHFVIDLITTGKFVHNHAADRCFGAYALDKKTGEVHTFLAPFTLLASGGAGKVYLITSNPDVATGDGVAMAWRVGAEVGNMEFIQFHPTCLYHPFARNFLISEAVRGEGGVLVNAAGERFMDKVHPLGSLAPRDIVSRAIDFEIKRTGAECVYLDITHLGQTAAYKFPHIHAKCLSLGIDITRQPIPVAPAAHFLCGGVATDAWAETTVHNLFAVGEVAFTGLHGANRLASNSLLEAAVFADRAVQRILEREPERQRYGVPDWDPFGATRSDEAIMVTHNWEEVRRTMSSYVGIVRSDKRLARARRRINMIVDEIAEYYWDFTVNSDLLELRNIALVAQLIIRSARLRLESRGLHYSLDHPTPLPEAVESRDRRRVSWIE